MVGSLKLEHTPPHILQVQGPRGGEGENVGEGKGGGEWWGRRREGEIIEGGNDGGEMEEGMWIALHPSEIVGVLILSNRNLLGKDNF